MTSILTPTRRRGVEYLDDPTLDDSVRVRSLADVARSNALFGGTSAVVREMLHAVHEEPPSSLTLLDIGTGIGDIPMRAREALRECGVTVTVYGVEWAQSLARAAANTGVRAVRASALALPFADRSVDVVMCSQLLHHFEGADSALVVREMARVACRRVIVSDLRRSWFAAAGIWAASFLLGFHPVSRHDGVVSVLRGYTPSELHRLVQDAVGRSPTVRRAPGFRVTASWAPAGVVA